MFYPDADAEKKEATFNRLKAIIEEKGKIENIDEWGMRKLAYLIEYYAEAYYILVEFEADVDAIREFDRVAKISDSLMRHMVVRVDD